MIDKTKLIIRKAVTTDIEGIYNVACSVSSKEKDSYSGFLMDDYISNPEHYKEFFLDKIIHLEYFFVAEYENQIIGFLLGYRKEMWLKYNKTWTSDIIWHPAFNDIALKNFIVIDKTAIISNHKGEGIGSCLYELVIQKMIDNNIEYMFAETIVDPVPNFASLTFRKKQKYTLAGTRYETYMGELYTDLIYYKKINLKS